MPQNLRRMVVGLLTAALIFTPLASALAQDNDIYIFRREPDGWEMIGDVLLVRPCAIVGLGVTSVFWVLGWPFAKLGGNTEALKQELLLAPYYYAFRRPVGEF